MKEINLTSVLCLVGAVLSLLTGIILLNFEKAKGSPRSVLGLYFLVTSFAQMIIVLVTTGWIVEVPHLFRTGVLAAYIFPPLAYLYVRQNYRPGISALDLIHFVPALLYFIDYVPFFLLPAQEKLNLIRSVTGDNLDQLFAHREGWITLPWFHMVLRMSVSLVYSLLSLVLVIRLTRVEHPAFYSENASLVRWLWTFVVFQFLIFVPYAILVLTGKPQYTFFASTFPFAMIGPVTCVVLFFKPSIFYGFSGLLIESGEYKTLREPATAEELQGTPGQSAANGRPGIQVLQQTQPEDMGRSGKLDFLSERELEQLRTQVNDFLLTHKSYLSPNYSINEFSKEIGVPARKISAYVNRVEQLNFRDFINRFRIEHCLANLHEGAWRKLTLEAIAHQCGFSNRNSFTIAFKKFSGTNPSHFVYQLKHGSN